jgi:hypothetical protein
VVDWEGTIIGIISGAVIAIIPSLIAYRSQNKVKELEFRLAKREKIDDKQASDADTKKRTLVPFIMALENMIMSQEYQKGIEPDHKIEETKRLISSSFLGDDKIILLHPETQRLWKEFRGEMMDLYRDNRPEYGRRVKQLLKSLNDEYKQFRREYKDKTGTDLPEIYNVL